MAHPPLAYEMYGLRIRSEVPLPARADRADAADLDIVWHESRIAEPDRTSGRVLAELSLPGGPGYTHVAADGGYALRYHGMCDVLVRADLRKLEVRLTPGADPALVPILLAGNALAFVLALAGEWVLHASAVRIDGRALAFAGASGRGKSSLAALCCTRGASLVTDDLLRLDQRPTGPHCFPGGTEIRLRPGAAGLAVGSGTARVGVTADGRTALRYDTGDPAMPPLHAVVLPLPARGRASLCVRRLEPRDALAALLACPRVTGLRAPELLAQQFQALARLVSAVPMYEALVPWGPPFDPGLPAALAREVGV